MGVGYMQERYSFFHRLLSQNGTPSTDNVLLNSLMHHADFTAPPGPPAARDANKKVELRAPPTLGTKGNTWRSGRQLVDQRKHARQTKLLHIAVFSKIEKNSALAAYPAQQFRRVETSRFQEESVLAGSERPIVEQEVQRVVRMVVEDQQFIAVVL